MPMLKSLVGLEWEKQGWIPGSLALEEGHLNNNNNNNCFQRHYSRFFTISSQRRKLSPTHTLKWTGRNHVQIMCNTSSAYHVQVSCYVPLGTRATWYEGSAQLLSLTELKDTLPQATQEVKYGEVADLWLTDMGKCRISGS